jgi:UDP-N-acetylmuramoylalanine--D-glutamate ligase
MGIEVISEIEFGFRIMHPDTKIIAITGSNGKSTTVSLIHHILDKSGYKTILAGNIGDAFTGYPIEKPGIDFVVLEISSFQLELIKTFKPDVAAILNVTPDHLNRYDSFAHYGETKFKIFSNMKSDDVAVINADDDFTNQRLSLVKGTPKMFSMEEDADIFYKKGNIYFGKETFCVNDISIKGPHNVANAMAAILSLYKYLSFAEIKAGLLDFKSLEHRLEFCGEVKGVKFYNDSKATNTDSVRFALQSFDTPVRIILGGSDKGEDFTVLNPYLERFAKHLYILGATREKMKEAYKGFTNLTECLSFEEAIKSAFCDSSAGDIILLSPACASYDMFKNYEQRGKRFKEIVQELADEA